MKHIFRALFISSFIFVGCGSDDEGSPAGNGGGFTEGNFNASAAYNLTFTTNFTTTTHPLDYPSDASFGTLIAITHAPEVSVYEIGQFASAGLKSYAEDGDVGTLATFISAELGEAGEGVFAISTDQAIAPQATKTISVTATPTRTRITFLAKLNPSPDWFVGVSSFDIVDGDNLVESAQFNLFPLDAGTDAGTTYSASNSPDNQVIKLYSGPPFGTGPFFPNLATLDIERQN